MNAADALLEQKAKAVYAYISHGVLSGGAVARVAKSRLKELVITDSIQPTKEVLAAGNIRVLPIAHADRRGDRAHRDRGVGVESVRLSTGENKTESMARADSAAKFSTKRFTLTAYCLWRFHSARLPMTGKSRPIGHR